MYNDYGYSSSSDFGGATLGIGAWLFILAVFIFYIIVYWKIYKKAGCPGWACIVPFYCNYKMSMFTFGSIVPFVLTFIPIVNLFAILAMQWKTAIVFGKGTGFGILTLFCPSVCLPIIAFGKAEYVGIDGDGGGYNPRVNNQYDPRFTNQDPYANPYNQGYGQSYDQNPYGQGYYDPNRR